MRQECRISKSVASGPCDWLLLDLAMRAQGAPLAETDGKIDEWQGIWGWDNNYPSCHCSVDKAMNTCESYCT